MSILSKLLGSEKKQEREYPYEWGEYVKGFYQRYLRYEDGTDVRIPYFSKIRPIDISSKEAYLKWVDDWKVMWKDLVVRIRLHRQAKRQFRDLARGLNRDINRFGAHDDMAERLIIARNEMWDHHWSAETLSKRARELHDLRMEGKQRSYAEKMKQS